MNVGQRVKYNPDYIYRCVKTCKKLGVKFDEETFSKLRGTVVSFTEDDGKQIPYINWNDGRSHYVYNQKATLVIAEDTECSGGTYRLTPCDPEFERKIEIAKRVQQEDDDILKTLSKS